MKKLVGQTDIEDALKRLDNLTNEEVRVVAAQVLEATHTVDDRVANVDDKVKAVGDKVSVVIDGAQPPLVIHRGNMLNSNVPRGKRDKDSHTTSGRRYGSSEALV